MNNKIFNYLQIAAKLAIQRDDQRSYLLGCVAVRSDGTMVRSVNGPTRFPTRHAHAEKRVAAKIDYGATIYVARVKLADGSLGLAKPCENCMKALISKKVRKIYYTITDNEYGVITL